MRRVGDQIEAAVLPQEAGANIASGPGEQAVNEYQSMLPKNLERGPLYHANQIMQPQVISVRSDDDVARLRGLGVIGEG